MKKLILAGLLGLNGCGGTSNKTIALDGVWEESCSPDMELITSTTTHLVITDGRVEVTVSYFPWQQCQRNMVRQDREKMLMTGVGSLHENGAQGVNLKHLGWIDVALTSDVSLAVANATGCNGWKKNVYHSVRSSTATDKTYIVLSEESLKLGHHQFTRMK